LVGVALLHGVWRPDFHWTGLTASVIFVSSFICEAAYSVLGKPIVQQFSVMKMLAISLVVGTAVNLVVDGGSTIEAARGMPLKSWGLLLALAIVTTVIGYTVWFVVIRECPVNVAALTVFAQAVFGVILAAVLLKEKPHWGQLWGSLCIVVGLAYGLSRQIHRQAQAAGDPAKPS
jgi:drug/metabolite transporter (DMT)-like permease